MTWTGITFFAFSVEGSSVGYRSPSQLAWSPSQSALWSTFCSRKLEAINANIVYLDVFVLIAQTFLKNPALLALAPKQSEMPFRCIRIVRRDVHEHADAPHPLRPLRLRRKGACDRAGKSSTSPA